MNNQTVIEKQKLIKTNQLVLLFGSSSYGLLYFFSGDVLNGIGILISTFLVVAITNYTNKKISEDLTVYILTFSQYTLIVFFVFITFEVGGGITLIAAAIAMNCLYYNKKIIISQWVISNILLIGAMAFGDVFYSNLSFSFILRSILGFNFSILFLFMLVRWGIDSLNSTIEKERKAESLVEEVNLRMQENKEYLDNQEVVFSEIKARSNNLNKTSEDMLLIASNLSQTSQQQADILENLSHQSEKIASDIKQTQEKAAASKDIANEGAQKLTMNNETMQLIVKTILDIETQSERIVDIIKNIESIAFQTNILALNASIEAARAGSAGKGFAVVADEVRNLSLKSSEAAQDSELLINSSISSVKQGVKLIKQAAVDMNEVIESSSLVASQAETISEVMLEQVKNVNSILEKIQEVTQGVQNTSKTAIESNNLANEVTKEIHYINTAIK